jgi:hypothetical protein
MYDTCGHAAAGVRMVQAAALQFSKTNVQLTPSETIRDHITGPLPKPHRLLWVAGICHHLGADF